MSEPKWTPGPWLLNSGTASNPEGHVWSGRRLVAGCMGFNDGTLVSHEENKANAHLVAAAPDLYEVLERLLSDLNMLWDAEPPGVSLSAARAALARARGEGRE